jgi:hypothetical protein
MKGGRLILWCCAWILFQAEGSAQTVGTTSFTDAGTGLYSGSSPHGSIQWLGYPTSPFPSSYVFTLASGFTLRFTLSVTGPITVVPTQPPTYSGAAFDKAGYTGVNGNVALYGNTYTGTGTVSDTIQVTSIVLRNSSGTVVTSGWTLVLADAESTNTSEGISGTTNGSNWVLLDTIINFSPTSAPTLTGLGTSSVTITGNSAGNEDAYILGTNDPTTLTATTTVGNGDRQGIAFGILVTTPEASTWIGGLAGAALCGLILFRRLRPGVRVA